MFNRHLLLLRRIGKCEDLWHVSLVQNYRFKFENYGRDIGMRVAISLDNFFGIFLKRDDYPVSLDLKTGFNIWKFGFIIRFDLVPLMKKKIEIWIFWT